MAKDPNFSKFMMASRISENAYQDIKNDQASNQNLGSRNYKVNKVDAKGWHFSETLSSISNATLKLDVSKKNKRILKSLSFIVRIPLIYYGF